MGSIEKIKIVCCHSFPSKGLYPPLKTLLCYVLLGIGWSGRVRLPQVFSLQGLGKENKLPSSKKKWVRGSVLAWPFEGKIEVSGGKKRYIPSLLSRMFMDTSLLQATLWGHSLPNPRGGEIFLNSVTTSTCLILPWQISQLMIFFM